MESPKTERPKQTCIPQTEDSNVTSALETSNQYAIFTEANTNIQQKQMPTKSYGSEQSQHVRQQLRPSCNTKNKYGENTL